MSQRLAWLRVTYPRRELTVTRKVLMVTGRKVVTGLFFSWVAFASPVAQSSNIFLKGAKYKLGVERVNFIWNKQKSVIGAIACWA
jgi:hypothetical protein